MISLISRLWHWAFKRRRLISNSETCFSKTCSYGRGGFKFTRHVRNIESESYLRDTETTTSLEIQEVKNIISMRENNEMHRLVTILKNCPFQKRQFKTHWKDSSVHSSEIEFTQEQKSIQCRKRRKIVDGILEQLETDPITKISVNIFLI